MTVLFGHPTGNPNSHHAALAHHEAGRLEAFCVAWMPAQSTLRLLERAGLSKIAARFSGRAFAPLDEVCKIEDRVGEARRMLLKAFGAANERLAYEANDWLMHVMKQECARASVKAVHAYEDCSLLQFEEAKRLGKACIYDLPIGYYPAWLDVLKALRGRYPDWMPQGGLPEDDFVRPEQKAAEIALADCVLAPSAFVAQTLRDRRPNADVRLARYGVEPDVIAPPRVRERDGPLRFLFVGQCSMRKGAPLLIEAWKAAGLKNATLDLVGGWRLSNDRLRELPPSVRWRGQVDRAKLQEFYHAADVFVLPTFFEGRALVVGEALAAGLPVITTKASGCEDLLAPEFSEIVEVGSRDALVGALERFSRTRSDLPAASRRAQDAASRNSWAQYRQAVREAVRDFA